ncbi:MAG: enolase C-terminal domain-like protein, partial [Waddliaceae bacterium]
MKILFAPYELQGKSSFSNRQGALLKFQFQDGSVGYADCHPWAELGDLPLKEQLSRLRAGTFTPLTDRSLIFAKIDAKARSQQQSLFSNLSIPPSHYLLEDAEQPIPDGFSSVKRKVGKSPSEEIPQVVALFNRLPKHTKVRLDFTSRLSKRGVEEYLRAIQKDIGKIDFIEDPFPYDRNSWETIQNNYGVRLACDHQSEKRLGDTESHCVTVIKPAVQDEQLFCDKYGL